MSGADGRTTPEQADPKKTTAWNGLVLHHPASWEVARLDRDSLVWSDGPTAALEIRWERHRGAYNPERQFRRFVRRARRKGLPQPESWQVPDSWRIALGRFIVSGFRWRRSDEEGLGLFLYCPGCRRLNLVQIHPGLSARPQMIPPLLSSLRDHPEGEVLPVRIFGIRGRLPLGSRLTQFRFETGHYRLLWRKDRLRIGLYRWAPAGIVLARQTLEAFTRDHLQLPDRSPAGLESLTHEGWEAVGGAWSWPWRGRHRPPAWLTNHLPRRFIRVWHVRDHNCLLGVAVRGRGGGLTAMFEQLCHHCEVNPP